MPEFDKSRFTTDELSLLADAYDANDYSNIPDDLRQRAAYEWDRAFDPDFEEPGFLNQLTGAFGEGLDTGTRRMFGSSIEAGGEALGLDSLRDYGAGVVERAEQDVEFRPAVPGFEDIRSGWDVLPYAGGMLGQGLSSLAPVVGGAVAGAGAGSLVAPGPGTIAGGVVGALGAGFGMNYGDTYAQLVEEGVDSETAARVAAPAGALMGALDALGAGKLIKPAAKQVGEKMVKTFAQRVSRGGAAEGLTEGAQAVIQEGTAALMTGNPNVDERIKSVINQFVAGSLTGGAVGGATAPFAAPQPTEEQKEQAALNKFRQNEVAKGRAIKQSGLESIADVGIVDTERGQVADPTVDPLQARAQSTQRQIEGVPGRPAVPPPAPSQPQAPAYRPDSLRQRVPLSALPERVRQEIVMRRMRLGESALEDDLTEAEAENYLPGRGTDLFRQSRPEPSVPAVVEGEAVADPEEQIDERSYNKASSMLRQRGKFSIADVAEAASVNMPGQPKQGTKDLLRALVLRGVLSSKNGEAERAAIEGRDIPLDQIELVAPEAEQLPADAITRYSLSSVVNKGKGPGVMGFSFSIEDQPSSILFPTKKEAEQAGKEVAASRGIDAKPEVYEAHGALLLKERGYTPTDTPGQPGEYIGEVQRERYVPTTPNYQSSVDPNVEFETLGEARQFSERFSPAIAQATKASRDAMAKRVEEKQAAMRPVFNALQRVLKKAKINKDVGLRLQNAVITPDGRFAEGSFLDNTDAGKLIRIGNDLVGLSDGEQIKYLSGVLNHEIIHAVRALGLFDAKEWRTLVSAASQRKSKAGGTFLQQAQMKYEGLSADAIQEEAVAEMYREWAANPSTVAGKPASLLRRIVRFLAELGGWAKENDFSSSEDIMRRLMEGDIGSRPRLEAAPEAIPLSDAKGKESEKFSIRAFGKNIDVTAKVEVLDRFDPESDAERGSYATMKHKYLSAAMTKAGAKMVKELGEPSDFLKGKDFIQLELVMESDDGAYQGVLTGVMEESGQYLYVDYLAFGDAKRVDIERARRGGASSQVDMEATPSGTEAIRILGTTDMMRMIGALKGVFPNMKWVSGTRMSGAHAMRADNTQLIEVSRVQSPQFPGQDVEAISEWVEPGAEFRFQVKGSEHLKNSLVVRGIDKQETLARLTVHGLQNFLRSKEFAPQPSTMTWSTDGDNYNVSVNLSKSVDERGRPQGTPDQFDPVKSGPSDVRANAAIYGLLGITDPVGPGNANAFSIEGEGEKVIAHGPLSTTLRFDEGSLDSILQEDAIASIKALQVPGLSSDEDVAVFGPLDNNEIGRSINSITVMLKGVGNMHDLVRVGMRSAGLLKKDYDPNYPIDLGESSQGYVDRMALILAKRYDQLVDWQLRHAPDTYIPASNSVRNQFQLVSDAIEGQSDVIADIEWEGAYDVEGDTWGYDEVRTERSIEDMLDAWHGRMERNPDALAEQAQSLSGQFDPEERFSLGGMTIPEDVFRISSNLLNHPVQQTTMEDIKEDLSHWSTKLFGKVRGDTWKTALKRNLISQFDRAFQLDRQLSQARGFGDQIELGSNMMGAAMENAMDTAGLMEHMIETGGIRLNENGEVEAIEESKGILEITERIGQRHRGWFQAYAIARRELELRAQGRPSFSDTSDEQLQAIIASAPIVDGENVFERVFNDLQEFNRNLLQFAKDSGLMDQATMDKFAAAQYVPFYRVMEDDLQEVPGETIGPKMAEVLNNPKSALNKELKGGDGRIGDFYENLVNNMESILKASLKNQALKVVSKTIDDLNAMGVHDVGHRIKNVRESKASQWKMGFYVDGKRVEYHIDDPAFWVTLASMKPIQNHALIQAASVFAKVLRDGITHMPGFMLANLWRGKISGYVISGSALDPMSTINGAIDAFNKGVDSRDIKLNTGMGGYTYGQGDRNFSRGIATRQRLKEGEKSLAQLAKDRFHAVAMFAGRVGEASEMAERVALYRKLLREGKSKKQAAYEAKNLINFNRRGAGQGFLGKILAGLIPMVPFLNARIQGLYRLMENQQGHPRVMGFPRDMFLRGLVVSAGTLLLYSLAKDDERWENETLVSQVNNDIIYTAGGRITLPRAFEVGALFSTMPILAIEAVRKKETNDLVDGMISVFLNTFSFDPTPQIARPIFEYVAGRNFFTGAPIEGTAISSYLPEHRFDERTSMTGRAFAEFTGGKVLTPNEFDHFIKGYLGGMGGFMLSAMDAVIAGTGVYPERPAGLFGDPYVDVGGEFLGIRRFFRENEDIPDRAIGEFYDMKIEASQTERTIKDMMMRGEWDDAKELLKENSAPVALRKMFDKVGRTISELNREKRNVMFSRDMTPQQKKARIAELNAQRIRLAQQASRMGKQYGL